MIYLDTNLLLPLVVQEPTSIAVTGMIGKPSKSAFVVSNWSLLEFSSAIARRVRMRNLSSAMAVVAEAKFEALLTTGFLLVDLRPEDVQLARSFVRGHGSGLRSGDAMHLAIAQNHGATAIYTLDQTMLEAGRALGLPMSRGID